MVRFYFFNGGNVSASNIYFQLLYALLAKLLKHLSSENMIWYSLSLGETSEDPMKRVFLREPGNILLL